MRNRGDIRNRAHFHAHRLDSTDGGFAAGARSFDNQIHFLHAHRHEQL